MESDYGNVNRVGQGLAGFSCEDQMVIYDLQSLLPLSISTVVINHQLSVPLSQYSLVCKN